MKITALKKQIKNPERVSIFIDNQYGFSLTLDELLAQKIKNGQEISQAELGKLKKISEDGKLRSRALEWLVNRPHSTRELKDYLRRKKASPELTEKLVAEFTRKKYLNEESYASWLAELRGRAGKSNRAIRSELFAKGVSREIIDQTLEEQSGELERLKVLIAKKRRLSRYQSDDLKLAKYLVSQGFNYYLVKETLKTD